MKDLLEQEFGRVEPHVLQGVDQRRIAVLVLVVDVRPGLGEVPLHEILL